MRVFKSINQIRGCCNDGVIIKTKDLDSFVIIRLEMSIDVVDTFPTFQGTPYTLLLKVQRVILPSQSPIHIFHNRQRKSQKRQEMSSSGTVEELGPESRFKSISPQYQQTLCTRSSNCLTSPSSTIHLVLRLHGEKPYSARRALLWPVATPSLPST